MPCIPDFVDQSLYSGAASQPASREAGGRCHKYHLMLDIIH